MVAAVAAFLVRRIAQHVLAAHLLRNGRVDLVGALFLRHLEHASAGLPANLLQYLLAVDARFLLLRMLAAPPASGISAATRIAPSATRIAPSATRIAPSAVMPATGISAAGRAAGAVPLLSLVVNDVDHRIGALRSLDRAVDRLFASAIDAIGEQHNRLAPLLLLHHFVGGQIDRIVEQRPPAIAMAARSLARSTARRIVVARATLELRRP